LIQTTLLHFQLEQLRLWTACGSGFVALVLVEGIAAFIQSIDHTLALVFFVVVLLKTVWES
jgi:hypothetical protein